MATVIVVDLSTGQISSHEETPAEQNARQELQAAGAAQAQAQATALAERLAATGDLRTTAQPALARLDDVIANGGSYTANQVRDAVVDLARMQRRLVRYLVAVTA